jgi:uncharacterized protein (DUF488 family)
MVIASIGYQGRSLDQLIATLRAAQIRLVFDVRDAPWSHKRGFSKRALGGYLDEVGIRYVHLAAAGNPREIRRSGGSSAEILARFREHLLRAPAVLDEIHAAALREPTALLCYEASAQECHRSVLLAELAARFDGVEVIAL